MTQNQISKTSESQDQSNLNGSKRAVLNQECFQKNEDETKLSNGNRIKLSSGTTVDTNANIHSGRLTHTLFSDATKAFYIVKIGGVVCKGSFSSIVKNGLYKLTGHFKFDATRQDWQFIIEKADRKVDDLVGIKEYLYREAPGLGIATINKLILAFGPNLLDVIKNDPKMLATMPGMTLQKAETLQTWYKGQESNARIKERLYEIGLLPSQVAKLIHHYGNYAEDKIRKDCFSLTAIHGFGFVTVSNIADLVGVPKTDPGRIKCATVYALNKMYEEGHTVIASSQIIREACALLNIDQKHVRPQFDKLVEDGEIIDSEYDFEKYCEEHGIIV